MLTFIHSRMALTAIMFAFVLGVWGAWDFWRGRGIRPSYWGALVIGEILLLAQGLLGVMLVLTGALPYDLLHFLYGVLVVLAWPAVYVYTHARQGRTEVGWYALVAFAIFLLALRAQTTG